MAGPLLKGLLESLEDVVERFVSIELRKPIKVGRRQKAGGAGEQDLEPPWEMDSGFMFHEALTFTSTDQAIRVSNSLAGAKVSCFLIASTAGYAHFARRYFRRT